MAAVGLARMLPEVRLGWDLASCRALIAGIDAEGLIAQISSAARSRPTTAALMNDAVFPEDPKKVVNSDELAARAALATADDLVWIDALWCDIGDAKRPVETTDLVLTAGQQRFIRLARELIEAAAAKSTAGNPGDEAWRETLFGPWRYRDNQHSLGWDPATQRLGAFSARDPGGSTASPYRGMALAYWLALEALPAFPMLGRSAVGVVDRGHKFTWPLWAPSLQFEAVASLLACATSIAPAERRRLSLSMFESRIGRSGRYGFLQPAART
jgi:hypothetical protein